MKIFILIVILVSGCSQNKKIGKDHSPLCGVIPKNTHTIIHDGKVIFRDNILISLANKDRPACVSGERNE